MKEEAAFINFLMPRVSFLHDAKFSSIAKFFKKITFSKEKPVLALNRQTNDNNHHIIAFKKLYEMYKNEFNFLVVDTNDITELFPHIDEDQPLIFYI